jgi:hypothetical protein
MSVWALRFTGFSYPMLDISQVAITLVYRYQPAGPRAY